MIFCRLCKYCEPEIFFDGWSGHKEYTDKSNCSHPKNEIIEITPIEEVTHWPLCTEMNKSNDCKLFELPEPKKKRFFWWWK